MSRSFVRMLATAALVATVPAVAQAQSCAVNSATAQWACAVPVDVTASFDVPFLAYMEVGDVALTFPPPAGSWAAFLDAPADETVVTGTLLTIRTNAPHTVTLTNRGWSGGTWAESDVSFGLKTGDVCAAGDAGAPLGIASNLYDGEGATNGVPLRYLCLGLAIPGDLASTKLAPGEYDLSLELTITAP